MIFNLAKVLATLCKFLAASFEFHGVEVGHVLNELRFFAERKDSLKGFFRVVSASLASFDTTEIVSSGGATVQSPNNIAVN